MANINELLEDHITLEVECIDRLYLNGYLPGLATGGGLIRFLTQHLGKPIPSPVLLGQMTQGWVEAVKALASQQGVPWVRFQHGERKEEVANRLRQQRGVRDQVVFMGVVQEKAQTFSARKEGSTFHYDRDKTVYVNHYYFYIDDEDFGPIFLKVCSYAPWSLKLCLNGQEWAKRQLEKQGIAFETLDNGFLSCADPEKLQQTCDRLGAEDSDRVFRKWLGPLPLPLGPKDREAGYNWQLSIWPMEVSLTQIFDRPQRGREFFEEVRRDNLDLGRPDRLQLIFDRRVTKATPGRFRTRVMQVGVHPRLHIQYKNFDLKQYFKQGRGLRTQGTFRNPKDFEVNKGLTNLPYLERLMTSHQPAAAGSRTGEPQLWPLRRQHPESGATDHDGRRSESAGIEVWRSSGNGLVGGVELVHALDPGLPPSRPASSHGRPAGSRSRLLLGGEDDV